jgi:uncharacterized protein YsxB (DUF464 family)
MTKITFYKNKDFLIGFEVVGHTGYAEQGSDIVCSAISSMTQMTVVGLDQVLKIKLNVKKDAKKGYLICKISKNSSNEEITKAQNLLTTLKISLEDVEKDYKKYINMEVKDEIY